MLSPLNAMSDSAGQIKLLTREIASLTATVQRESQRRASMAAHAKTQEELAADTQIRLRQVQYANRKMEQELKRLNNESQTCSLRQLRQRLLELEKSVESRAATAGAEMQRIRLLAGHLQSALAGPSPPSFPALREHLAQISGAATEAEGVLCGTHAPRTSPPQADDEKEQLRAEVQRLEAELAAAKQQPVGAAAAVPGAPVSVDVAVQELQAVVPQYRAAAAQLQGHATVLRTQLAAMTADRDELKGVAAKWQAAAEKHEAAFAAAAAKLHSLEVKSIAASAATQQRADQLSAETAQLRQRCSALDAALQDAQLDAAHAQQQLAAKSALVQTQQETIGRLEGTISEQQADIVAALDLVCARSPAPETRPSECRAAPAAAAAAALHALSFDWEQRNEHEVEQGCCGGGEQDSSAAWSIPAALHDAEWLHEPLEVSSHAAAEGCAKAAPAYTTQPSALQDVAADIAALQEALRHALSDRGPN